MDAQFISDRISNTLTNKQFDDHEDEVKRRGGFCKGNERWVNGIMQSPTVLGNLDGMTYTGKN